MTLWLAQARGISSRKGKANIFTLSRTGSEVWVARWNDAEKRRKSFAGLSKGNNTFSIIQPGFLMYNSAEHGTWESQGDWFTPTVCRSTPLMIWINDRCLSKLRALKEVSVTHSCNLPICWFYDRQLQFQHEELHSNFKKSKDDILHLFPSVQHEVRGDILSWHLLITKILLDLRDDFFRDKRRTPIWGVPRMLRSIAALWFNWISCDQGILPIERVW